MLELLLHEEYESDFQGFGQPRTMSRHSEVTKSKKQIVAKCKLEIDSAKEIITNFPKTAQKISFSFTYFLSECEQNRTYLQFFQFYWKRIRGKLHFSAAKTLRYSLRAYISYKTGTKFPFVNMFIANQWKITWLLAKTATIFPLMSATGTYLISKI